MEVIAKKKQSIIILYAIFAVLGLAIMVLGIVVCHTDFFSKFDSDSQFYVYLIIIIGATEAVVFTFLSFRYGFSMDKITYNGEKIDFGKGRIEKPSQILNVEYHNNYFTERTDVWGSLTVQVGDTTIKYYCIERVGEVCKRLLELKCKDPKGEAEITILTENK